MNISLFVWEGTDGSAVVVKITGMDLLQGRQAGGSYSGKIGELEENLPVTSLWSFSLTASYRCTVNGIHPPIHLPISSFHFILFNSTDICYAPALFQALC